MTTQQTTTQQSPWLAPQFAKRLAERLLADLPPKELEAILEQLQAPPAPLYLSAKVKIRPTPEQQAVLWALAENCRLIYNFALAERKEWWTQNKSLPRNQRTKAPTFCSQSKQLPQLKEVFPRYQQNYSKNLQETLKQLDSDFRSFYALRKQGYEEANPPGWKGKKYFTTLIYNQSGFKIEGRQLTLSHFYPEKGQQQQQQQVVLAFELLGPAPYLGKQIKQVVLVQEHRSQDFFVTISYEEPSPPYFDNGKYQAFDLGISNLVAAVNSHAGKGFFRKNPKIGDYWQPKLEEVQAKRDHCKKGSRRWQRYHAKYRRMQRKAKNQRKDFQHKLAKQLLTHTKANTLLVGALAVQQMNQSQPRDAQGAKTKHRHMQNSGITTRFSQFLSYKARRLGKRVVRLSERNTSKRCCLCGTKKPRPLSERVIHCEFCGLIIDRDLNAAVNLLQRFLAVQWLVPLSRERPMVGQPLAPHLLLQQFRERFFAIHSPGLCLAANAQRTRKQSATNQEEPRKTNVRNR